MSVQLASRPLPFLGDPPTGLKPAAGVLNGAAPSPTSGPSADRYTKSAPGAPRNAWPEEDGASLSLRLRSLRRERAEVKQAEPPIPDVHAHGAAPSLRSLDLNRQINADYGRLAQRFQAIVDPGFSVTGSSVVFPVWFAFAAFASRGIGQAELGAQIATETARAYHEGWNLGDALCRAGLPSTWANMAASTIEQLFAEPEERTAAAFAVALATAGRNHRALDGMALTSMLDPRTLICTVQRTLQLVAEAPGAGLLEKLESLGRTLHDTMEDGNRRIHRDIGGAAQDYLRWRDAQAGRVTPEQVLEGFVPYDSPQPKQAHEAYSFALQHLHDQPQPTNFDQLFPAPRYDSRNLVIAGFALYEKAGQTADPAERNRLVAFANNLLIYREQHDAVQPAFAPGRVLPGEVDRVRLMELITPTIQVAVRGETWKFHEYATRSLGARDSNPLTSRATEYNWGRFEDRWDAVVDTFAPCYRNPRAMWPMPDPDPGVGM